MYLLETKARHVLCLKVNGRGLPERMVREKIVWPFLLSPTDGQVSPWTARRSNHSVLKEINPKYSLERLMLKLQYFGHRM